MLASGQLRGFSSKQGDADDKPAYSFADDQIKGTTRGVGGLLLMAYTCGKCDRKQARTFSKDSYTKGVVLLRCEGCDSLHLVADNLGWFRDGKTNIEDLMREKGESVSTNLTDQALEIVRREDVASEGPSRLEVDAGKEVGARSSTRPELREVRAEPTAKHSFTIMMYSAEGDCKAEVNELIEKI